VFSPMRNSLILRNYPMTFFSWHGACSTPHANLKDLLRLSLNGLIWR
jgi:hypothetical protein